MAKIAGKFELSLEGSWNKAVLPHLGRHPNAYHRFVLRNMMQAERQAGGSQQQFIRLFNELVVEPVKKNPNLLRKSGWT